MITEEQIKELAHSIWEKEGRLSGKDLVHYFRAKKILEELESSRVIELAAPSPQLGLGAPQPVLKLGTPPGTSRRRKKR